MASYFSPQRHKGHKDLLPPSTPSLERAPRGLIGLALDWWWAASWSDRGKLFSPQRRRGHKDFLPPSTPILESTASGVIGLALGLVGAAECGRSYDDFLTTKTQRAQRYLATEAQRFLDSGCGEFRGGCAAGQCVARRGDLSLGRPGRSPLQICIERLFFHHKDTKDTKIFLPPEYTELGEGGERIYWVGDGSGGLRRVAIGAIMFSPQRHKGHKDI